MIARCRNIIGWLVTIARRRHFTARWRRKTVNDGIDRLGRIQPVVSATGDAAASPGLSTSVLGRTPPLRSGRFLGFARNDGGGRRRRGSSPRRRSPPAVWSVSPRRLRRGVRASRSHGSRLAASIGGRTGSGEKQLYVKVGEPGSETGGTSPPRSGQCGQIPRRWRRSFRNSLAEP